MTFFSRRQHLPRYSFDPSVALAPHTSGCPGRVLMEAAGETLPPGWRRKETRAGKVYYTNAATGETQYEPPAPSSPAGPVQAVAAAASAGTARGSPRETPADGQQVPPELAGLHTRGNLTQKAMSPSRPESSGDQELTKQQQADAELAVHLAEMGSSTWQAVQEKDLAARAADPAGKPVQMTTQPVSAGARDVRATQPAAAEARTPSSGELGATPAEAAPTPNPTLTKEQAEVAIVCHSCSIFWRLSIESFAPFSCCKSQT